MKTISSLKPVLLFIIISTATLLMAGCSNKQQEQGGGFPPPQVSVAEVIARHVTPWNEFSGRIEAKENVQIRSRVDGVIEAIRYKEGELVNKGDLMFVIDARPFRADLRRAEAELSHARAQLDLAKSESKRAINLVERKLLSQDEFDQKIASETQANASVNLSKANVELAQLTLEYTNIRSPIDGIAGRASITKGNLVSSSPTAELLTTVISLNPVYAYFDSDELTYLRNAKNTHLMKESDQQQKLQSVFVGLSNEEGFPHEGYIDFIDNKVNSETGTIRMRAVLDNKNHHFSPGLFARIKLLDTQSNDAILIDDRAIMTDQDRKYVFILGPENKALRRNITLGQIIEGLRVVTTGLQENDKVIVHGIQKVFFPGMPVNPQIIVMGDSPIASTDKH